MYSTNPAWSTTLDYQLNVLSTVGLPTPTVVLISSYSLYSKSMLRTPLAIYRFTYKNIKKWDFNANLDVAAWFLHTPSPVIPEGYTALDFAPRVFVVAAPLPLHARLRDITVHDT